MLFRLLKKRVKWSPDEVTHTHTRARAYKHTQHTPSHTNTHQHTPTLTNTHQTHTTHTHTPHAHTHTRTHTQPTHTHTLARTHTRTRNFAKRSVHRKAATGRRLLSSPSTEIRVMFSACTGDQPRARVHTHAHARTSQLTNSLTHACRLARAHTHNAHTYRWQKVLDPRLVKGPWTKAV